MRRSQIFVFTPSPKTSKDLNHRDVSCSFNVPCDNPANRDASNFTTIKYFQVQWHVFTDGGASTNIDQAMINTLMVGLNADFAAYNIVLCTDSTQFIEDAANYTHDRATDEFSLKNTYAIAPSKLINVYVVGTMTPYGYAHLPYDPNGGTNINEEIVLNQNYTSVGMHTLAHNMGHIFGLEHTFAGVSEIASCSSCYEKVRNINGSSNTTGVSTPLGGSYTSEGDKEGDWCSDTNQT